MHASELEKWQRREIFRANTALLSLEFILYPFSRSLALSLSIYLSISVLLSRIITVSSTTLKSRGNYIVFSLPVVVLSFADLKSVNQAIHKNLTEYYVHLDAFRNADSSKEKFASVTTRLLLIYRLVTCGHRTARA